MEEFIAGQRANLDQVKSSPYFRDLIGSLDSVYRAVVKSLPPDGFPIFFGRVVLVCHKSMLSAATLIAQCQPEDSSGITRRAVEAARIALAIKLNDDNAAQWLAYQERHDRWLKRQQDEKPKPGFHVHLKDIKGDAEIEKLDKYVGMLSDAYVHFTPEFYASLDWEVRTKGKGGEVFLNYFHRQTREIDRQFIGLGAAHVVILEALDRCYDGLFRTNPNVWSPLSVFLRIAKDFSAGYQREYGTPGMPSVS